MAKDKVLGIIPARIGSTRIPGKMLEDLGGKPLIQRTYERTLKAESLDAVIVATDSEDIKAVMEKLGAQVIMTPSELKNGTERSGVAVRDFTDFDPDIVVTVWGDEPLYPASVIDKCVQMLIEQSDLQVSTSADRITDPDMIGRNSVCKVVTDVNDHAMYISRSVIPYDFTKKEKIDYYHVTGAMALRKDFLLKYVEMEQTPLEKIDGIEQLRIMENGYKLGIVKGDFANLGVNTPEELIEVRRRYEAGEVG